MKYTYIHIIVQEKNANDFLKLAALATIEFYPPVRTPGSCYYYYRTTGISHVQIPTAEEKIKTFITDLIQVSSDIFYRIEKL